MPTCPPPRSTPAPTPKPNAKPSRAPTSRSPPNPWPTGQQTKISSHGSTASASNTIGLCGRNRHAWLCYQRRCCCQPHNPAIHIMTQVVDPRTASPWLGCQPGILHQLSEHLVDADVEQPGSPGGDEEARDLGSGAQAVSHLGVVAQCRDGGAMQREPAMFTELGIGDLQLAGA